MIVNCYLSIISALLTSLLYVTQSGGKNELNGLGVGRYVGFTPMWERTICGIRAGKLDISPVRGIGNTHTRLHFYG